MIDIITDTILDSLKMLPFLFLAFLIIEYTEHKLNSKAKEKIEKSGKYGPIVGGLLGLVPECGFSVIATNLYIARIITLGTLIAVYLTTSDEMLVFMLASSTPFNLIIKVILIKLFIGIIAGLIIDKLIKKRVVGDYHICEHDHCHCHHDGVLKSSISHTLKTLFFIFIVTLILNVCFAYFGEEYLTNIFKSASASAPLITALIGLIPSCSASLLITTLLVNNVISLGAAVAGLLSSAGIGLLVLLKNSKNKKENIQILLLLYLISAVSGIIINYLNI